MFNATFCVFTRDCLVAPRSCEIRFEGEIWSYNKVIKLVLSSVLFYLLPLTTLSRINSELMTQIMNKVFLLFCHSRSTEKYEHVKKTLLYQKDITVINQSQKYVCIGRNSRHNLKCNLDWVLSNVLTS